MVRVPLGISGSLPSARAASAAMATEPDCGVPPSGEYCAPDATCCAPSSEVDFQTALPFSSRKVSSTFAPNVLAPVTW